MSILKTHDSLLLDLDGTVWEGGQALQCVVDVVNSCGIPTVYVTNNASRSPQTVAETVSYTHLTLPTSDLV